MIKSDGRREKHSHIQEHGQRRPEGWSLRRGQLDEQRPGEEHGEQRTEREQACGELEEAYERERMSRWGWSQAGAHLGFEVPWEVPAGFSREERLSYEGWSPHLRGAIHHHLLQPRPC